MFGDRMKACRLALGYSAEQVAAFLELSPATVYRYENGDISKLPARLLPSLAQLLNTTPAYLMGWEADQDDDSDPEEDQLLQMFRSLSPNGRRLMLERAQELVILYGKKSDTVPTYEVKKG